MKEIRAPVLKADQDFTKEFADCTYHYNLQIDNEKFPVTTHTNPVVVMRWQHEAPGKTESHFHCIDVEFKKEREKS